MRQDGAAASSIGVSPNLTPRRPSVRAALRAARPHLDDLAEDRDGDLGRRLGADVEADRPMDARELLVGDAGLGQPFLALGVGARLPSAPI
jgi:hypothetical protein